MEASSPSRLAQYGQPGQNIDLIRETKKLVANKTEQQRFKMANTLLFSALDYKTPRIDLYLKNVPLTLHIIYNFQTFFLWRHFLLLCAYLFMYASFFGSVHPSYTLIGIELGFLLIFVLDTLMEIYHKSYHILRPSSKFQARFYVRIITLTLLIADSIICASTQALPVRPFLICRCILPIMYDQHMRKLIYALFASYKDIFVYILFFTFVLISFAIMANQFIQIPPGVKYDDFTGNYKSLGKTIFILYVLTTFDAYPDNQLVAIRINEWIYGFFIVFIFLNALFFVTIPTNILLNSIKQTRSKSIIIDQIQQQHSLIMAFICLGGDSKMSITYQKLIRFLLFVFNNEVKHIDKIAQICRKLDEKVNGTIEVNQFMQLCKIIQSNNYLRPPRFKTPPKLTDFQNFIDNILKLKIVLKSNKYQAFVSIYIFLTFINCILTMYIGSKVFDIIDDILMMIYIIEVLFRFIGLGPVQFFQRNMNTFDLIVVIVGFFFEIAPQNIVPRNADVIIKMFRIFRITILIKLIAEYFHFEYKSEVYIKLIELINQIAMIVPIVLKFFPLYMLSFYFLGVVGIQAFCYETEIKPSESPYSMYNEFSNFRTLLGSQFIFVQALTQAGWSLVAYDHAYRYGVFALTMLFFVISHEVIVIILTSLMKGVTWQVYNTIHTQLFTFQEKLLEEDLNFKNLKKRYNLVEQTKELIESKQNVLPENLVTRELYEKKIDQIILAKLIELQTRNKGVFYHKKKRPKTSQQGSLKYINETPYRSILLGDILSHKKISDHVLSLKRLQSEKATDGVPLGIREELPLFRRLSERQRGNESNRQLLGAVQNSDASSLDIGALKEQDIEKEIDNVLSNIVLHSGIKYSLRIQYPPQFVEFLKTKVKPLTIQNFSMEFDINKDIFARKDSLNLLVHGLHTLLELQTSERQHRLLILSTMVKKGMITQERASKMLTERSFFDTQLIIDYNWIIRKMYLSNLDEQEIRMFEIQYFSSVYGDSFKQINKVTIFPLMRLQARLIYCFNNLLRYREISTYEFFNTLSHIENKISTKLQREGSLCKFVYQIDTNSETWFTVELKDSNQLRVHFIKNGIWIYHQQMKKDQIYIGRDAFNWPNFNEKQNKEECAAYMKNFFQNFESLAFCINDYETFFEPNPQKQTYDLYTFFRQVEACKRYVKKQLSISKIMLVMLSKQLEKPVPLPYSLSDLKYDEEKMQAYRRKKMPHFKLDQTQSQIFQRLKKLEKDEEMISERQGMPYSYIINFLIQVRESMMLNERNFVFHVESLLNQHFKQSTINTASRIAYNIEQLNAASGTKIL